ncbi:MAG TPA: D-aminoacylase [Selenomonadales bacterium]|nr:D-aminoacylase [Selenomonadales bacterium]
MLDCKITQGTVYDGLGGPPTVADVGVKDGKIAAVGSLGDVPAREILPAEGLCVCPGFIDVHSHTDDWYFLNPWAVSKLLQGVTTEIIGNCGDSAAPLAAFKSVRTADGSEFRWRTTGEFMAAVQSHGLGINAASLIGHGNLRSIAVGEESGRADRNHLQAMKRLLRRSLADGALGLSTGLVYPPGCFADTVELTALGVTLLPAGGIYTSHIRDEGDRLTESVREVIELCRATGVTGVVSHHKAAGRKNWGKTATTLRLLAAARADGLRIFCDVYPYTALNTGLGTLLPLWSHSGGRAAMLERLDASQTLPEIRREVEEKAAGDYANIIITKLKAPEHRELQGRSLAEIAARLGLSPSEAVIALLRTNAGEVDMIWHALAEEDLQAVLAAPFAMIGSDAGARVSYGPLAAELPHPRSYGTFPRVIARYVRELGLLSLAEAIRKMTSLPAQVFGLANRGRLTSGCAADITIFDFAAICDTATYANPFQQPAGVLHVLVNGVPAVWDGKLQYRAAGRFLRRRHWR